MLFRSQMNLSCTLEANLRLLRRDTALGEHEDLPFCLLKNARCLPLWAKTLFGSEIGKVVAGIQRKRQRVAMDTAAASETAPSDVGHQSEEDSASSATTEYSQSSPHPSPSRAQGSGEKKQTRRKRRKKKKGKDAE